MKRNLNKQPITILSILLFSIGLFISFNIFAQAAGEIPGEIAAREAGDAALQSQIDDLAPVIYAVGDTLSDGSIVFWVDETGQHGLTAWPSDDIRSNWYSANEQADTHGPGWHLPTRHELNLLFIQKDVVSGFAIEGYWSSTEFSSNLAWFQAFDGSGQGTNFKFNAQRVRAVRAF